MKNKIILAVAGLLILFGNVLSSNAQVKRVQMHMSLEKNRHESGDVSRRGQRARLHRKTFQNRDAWLNARRYSLHLRAAILLLYASGCLARKSNRSNGRYRFDFTLARMDGLGANSDGQFVAHRD